MLSSSLREVLGNTSQVWSVMFKATAGCIALATKTSKPLIALHVLEFAELAHVIQASIVSILQVE